MVRSTSREINGNEMDGAAEDGEMEKKESMEKQSRTFRDSTLRKRERRGPAAVIILCSVKTTSRGFQAEGIPE